MKSNLHTKFYYKYYPPIVILIMASGEQEDSLLSKHENLYSVMQLLQTKKLLYWSVALDSKSLVHTLWLQWLAGSQKQTSSAHFSPWKCYYLNNSYQNCHPLSQIYNCLIHYVNYIIPGCLVVTCTVGPHPVFLSIWKVYFQTATTYIFVISVLKFQKDQ